MQSIAHFCFPAGCFPIPRQTTILPWLLYEINNILYTTTLNYIISISFSIFKHEKCNNDRDTNVDLYKLFSFKNYINTILHLFYY